MFLCAIHFAIKPKTPEMTIFSKPIKALAVTFFFFLEQRDKVAYLDINFKDTYGLINKGVDAHTLLYLSLEYTITTANNFYIELIILKYLLTVP